MDRFLVFAATLVACGGTEPQHSTAGAPVVASSTTTLASATSEPLVPLPVMLAAGRDHTCAIQDGRVFCWGGNALMQLGDGTTTPRARPIEVKGVVGAVQVAAGWYTSCALTGDRRVTCWGVDQAPAVVHGIDDVAQVVVADDDTCALRADGTVHCWGRGEGMPTRVEGVERATQIAAAPNRGCARLSDGRVSCWPSYPDGHREPVQVQRLRNVRSVAAGGSEQCALLDAGTVHCWSDGDPKPVDGISDGIALGLGGFDKCAIRSAGGVSCWGSIGATNQELASLAKERLVGIAAGVVHTCVHDAAMKTWCWGGSGAGQLGNGSMLFLLHPSQLPIGGVEELAAGDGWNCARLSSGDVRCWGSVARPSLDPVRWVGVTGLTNVETLCGGGDHMCALAGGSVWCWSKERPDTSDLADPYPPLAASRVVGVSKVTSLACGRTSRCAVAAGGVRCWRDEQPEPVANLKGARAVVVGGRHACARMTNGTVRCWGNNEQGQLGLEGGGDHGAVPTGGLDHVVELAASDTTTCARLENGRVWCWGEHPHGTPVAGHEHLIDAGLANVVSLTAGHGHHCAILGDRRALCWGANKHGQLGNGLMGGRQEAEPPSQGVQLEDITAIAAGAHHSCAVDTALHVWCWGSDADDALMHPETGDSARPVVVAW